MFIADTPIRNFSVPRDWECTINYIGPKLRIVVTIKGLCNYNQYELVFSRLGSTTNYIDINRISCVATGGIGSMFICRNHGKMINIDSQGENKMTHVIQWLIDYVSFPLSTNIFKILQWEILNTLCPVSQPAIINEIILYSGDHSM